MWLPRQFCPLLSDIHGNSGVFPAFFSRSQYTLVSKVVFGSSVCECQGSHLPIPTCINVAALSLPIGTFPLTQLGLKPTERERMYISRGHPQPLALL